MSANHSQLFRAQPEFAVEAKLNIIGTNMWKPGCPGHRFYEEVLTQAPVTVGEAIEKAGALTEPYTAKQVQGHLRWMFTWSGGPLEVDGVRHAAPAEVAKEAAPKPAKVAKAKRSKKAEATAEAA